MEQADIDPSWLGTDEDNYTITEPEFRGVLFPSINKTIKLPLLRLYKYCNNFYRAKRVRQKIHLENRTWMISILWM